MPPPAIRGLRPETPVPKAAGLTLHCRARDLAATLARALDPHDEEGIHDLRVASRRLRAAIDAYASLFPRKGLQALRRDVRDLFRATGPARDLEVQITFITKEAASGAPPAVRRGLDDILDELQSRYDMEVENVRKAVELFGGTETIMCLHWFVWGATGVRPRGGRRA